MPLQICLINDAPPLVVLVWYLRIHNVKLVRAPCIDILLTPNAERWGFVSVIACEKCNRYRSFVILAGKLMKCQKWSGSKMNRNSVVGMGNGYARLAFYRSTISCPNLILNFRFCPPSDVRLSCLKSGWRWFSWIWNYLHKSSKCFTLFLIWIFKTAAANWFLRFRWFWDLQFQVLTINLWYILLILLHGRHSGLVMFIIQNINKDQLVAKRLQLVN